MGLQWEIKIMIKIDFKNKQIEHTCSDNDNACGKVTLLSFDDFKNKNYNVVCTPCDSPDSNHDWKKCTHCPVSEGYNLTAFIQNLELHDNPREMQAVPEVWENNRQYHILRRILEDGLTDEDATAEVDLYEQVHQKVGRKAFHKVWVEHENGTKNMRDFLSDKG